MEEEDRREQRSVAKQDKANAAEQYLESVRAGDGIDEHTERGVRKAPKENQPARHQPDARPCSEQDACEYMCRVRRAARSEQQHRQPVGRMREADARRPVVHSRAEAGEHHQAAAGVVVRARYTRCRVQAVRAQAEPEERRETVRWLRPVERRACRMVLLAPHGRRCWRRSRRRPRWLRRLRLAQILAVVGGVDRPFLLATGAPARRAAVVFAAAECMPAVAHPVPRSRRHTVAC